MKKLLYVLSCVFIAVLLNVAAKYSGKYLSYFCLNPQKEQIEKIVHDYLLNNPKILVEVNQKLQEQEQKEQEEQIEKIKANIPKYKDRIFDTKAPGRITFGNPQGKVILVEFTQHQCHHCKDASPIVEKLVKNNPEIQLVVVYWPFFGDKAIHTAKAVLAAQKQNKAEELNKAFFAHEGTVNENTAKTIIKSIEGLDDEKLSVDMNAKEHEDGLKETLKLAQDLGLIGTPTLIFTNREMTKFSLVPGQTSNFENDLIKSLNEVK